MSYRQHSFDPSAQTVPGKPLRPFNWVQWVGVAMETFAIVWLVLFTAAKLGWAPWGELDMFPATVPAILGAALINSRREPDRVMGTEEMTRNRNWLLWGIAILACVAGILLATQGGR